jgi:hypothetical protein
VGILNEEDFIVPYRYACDVMEEMRTAVKVLRIDMLPGLIEEMQTMVNRMEAKLADYSSMGYELEKGAEFRKELKKMKREAEGLAQQMEVEE